MGSVLLRLWPSLEDPEGIFGGDLLRGFTLQKKLEGAHNRVSEQRGLAFYSPPLPGGYKNNTQHPVWLQALRRLT